MIKLIIVAVLIASIIVWRSLTDQSWQTLGSNIFVSLLQLAVGLVITELLIKLHRRKKLTSVSGIEIGVCLGTIEKLLYEYANERLKTGPLKGRWDLKSALQHDLATRVPTLEWNSGYITKILDKYRNFLDIYDAAPLLEIRDQLNKLIRFSSLIGLSEAVERQEICSSLQRILENLKSASGVYSYKSDMKRFRRIEQLMSEHHKRSFEVGERVSSIWWKARKAIGGT